MSYQKLKIAGREVFALIPADAKNEKVAEAKNGAPPKVQELVRTAHEMSDAVAFAFIRGRWHAAA